MECGRAVQGAGGLELNAVAVARDLAPGNSFSYDATALVRGNVRLVAMANYSPWTLGKALAFLRRSRGRVPFERLVSHVYLLAPGRSLTRHAPSSYSDHMKVATITEAKNQLSALIDRVRHGETIVITDRGRPVARLVSAVTESADDPEGRLTRLERRGGLRRATAPPPRALIRTRLPKLRKPVGVLDALLEERRQGR